MEGQCKQGDGNSESQKEMLETKNAATKMKDASHGLAHQQADQGKERTSKFKEISIKTFKLNYKEKKIFKKIDYPGTIGQFYFTLFYYLITI